MDIVVMLAFVFLPPVIAFYAAHLVDEKIWNAQYPVPKARKLAGWNWIAMSLLPFATGTLILVFVWLPTLRQTDFINKVVPFIFGAMHILLGIVFVCGGLHYLFKKH